MVRVRRVSREGGGRRGRGGFRQAGWWEQCSTSAAGRRGVAHGRPGRTGAVRPSKACEAHGPCSALQRGILTAVYDGGAGGDGRQGRASRGKASKHGQCGGGNRAV